MELNWNYYMENIQDLGIQVDAKLKFHTHTDTVVKKAYCVLNWASFVSQLNARILILLLKLYAILVCSIVEYNNFLHIYT